ncbi:MAG: PstS family phosphate ABC transporter substrate-binding protein [Desulfohalobiaceae bacterium]|nr:PstS family phosphate ABC transporter substrate-binding protein [Desulfohalobiaceae bacterium]
MKRTMKRLAAAVAAATILLAFGAGNVQARDQIRIVGSSTVYPFASYVCEEFGATTQYPTPVIESTGSGGGLKLFSEGVSLGTPDISNASRQMKLSEYERCMENGVERIHEVVFGYDGISLCENKANPGLNLSLKELALAVAAKVPQNGKLVKNPYEYWDQIDSDLPHREILIYGPPTTSGTRDAFEDLVMETATKEMAGYDGAYTNIRQDGLYVPSGENDNLIVQRLNKNKDAMGIFGYSYLDNNRGKIQPVTIDGVEPTTESISSGKYPVARDLYFYVKLDHLGKVSGLKEYVDLFLSRKMIGDRGYLKRQGLIPMPKKMREQERKEWKNRELLQKSDLK